MKKILIFPLAFLCLHACAQTNKPGEFTQHMLWYKGKKVNDSMLVTQENTRVLYSRKRDLLVVEPDKKKDPATRFVTELGRSEERKKECYSVVAKKHITIMWYPAVENTMKEFDDLTSSYRETLKNQVKLPSVIGTSTASHFNPRGGYASAKPRFRYELISEEVRRVYNQVLSLMKNYPPISFDAPPTREFGACFNCDSSRSNDHRSEVNKWIKEFSKYEEEVATLAISVIRTLQTPPNNSDAESAKMTADMEKAMEFASNRLRNKVDLLIRNHGNDITKFESVIKASISIERQRQLLGHSDEASFSALITKLIALFDHYDAYLLKQMEEKNYDFVLDLPFHFAVERQRQLLGGNEDGFKKYIDRFIAFNRFRFDMEMDYDGEYYGCNLPSKEKTNAKSKDFYVSLGLVNCKYQLFLANEFLEMDPSYHFGRRFNFVMNITSGVYTDRWANDEDKCQQTVYNYTGLEVRPYAPISSFTFCRDEQDSMQLMGMHLPFSHEDVKGARMFSKFSLLYRDDLDATGEFIQKVEDAAVELDQINKLIGQYEMNPNHPDPTKEQMRNMYEITVRKEELMRILNENEDTKKQSLIMFDAQNKAPVLMNEKTTLKYDGGADSDKFKIDIRLRITHEPLPYR